MATTATLTGTFTLPNDAAPDSAVLSVTLSAMDTDQNTRDVLMDDGSFTVALVAGAIPAGQEIWKNTAGLRGTHYRATLAWTASDGRLLSRYLGSFQVGDDASYDMADLLDQPPIATLPEGWYSTLTQGDYDAAITARDEAVAAAAATAADAVATAEDRAAIEAQAASYVTLTGSQTLTNKTINLASNTLVATSAQLRAALTDETGTGAAVFAGSPVLTGTPSAPTAAQGTNTTQVATTAFANEAWQPFASLADFNAATIPAPVTRTAFVVDGRAYPVIRDAAGSITQSDGTKWRPDGAATPQHYGASTGATGAANLTAFVACIAAHADTIVPAGTYTIGGQLRLAGLGKRIRGESATVRSTLSFEDTFDGACVLFEPTDPAATTMISNNGLRNLELAGNASTRAGRWAIDIRKQEQFRLTNVRWGGFSYGVRIAGGQFIYLDNFYGFGSGLAAGAHLSDSTQILIEEASTSGADQPNYNTFLTNFNLSGSSSKNIRDVITLGQADGLYIGPGYASYGNRSLLRLEGKSGHAITAVFFNSVYFDGVSPATGSENIISVLDNAVVGQQTIAFSNCYLGNTTGDIISAGVSNNLRDLRFSSCRFNASTTGIGTIKGQSSPIDGLRLIMSGCSFGGAPLGLTIDGGQSVQIDAVCEDIDDATGCIKLTGTIRSRSWSVIPTNCAAGVSDTSTGRADDPEYEWEADYAAVKGAAVQTSATDTTTGALMAVGAFGLGSENVPSLTDLTLAIPTGEYQVKAAAAASGTLGGPEVAAWDAAVSVTSTAAGTLFLYQRASAASKRRWAGFRSGSTGAVTWTELVAANSYATSISATPRFVTQHAVVAGEAYIAVGTASAADWKKVTP